MASKGMLLVNSKLTEAEVLKQIEHLRNVKGVPRLAARMLKKYLATIPSRLRHARMYLLLANLYVDIGETKKAFAAFRIAARKAKSGNDSLTLADILRKWGYLYLHTEKYLRQAKEKIVASVEIINDLLRKSGGKDIFRVAANCYASLGNYYHSIQDQISAKKAYEKALEFTNKGGFRERAVTVLGDLGSIAITEKRWSDARELLENTRKHAQIYYQHALPAALLRLGRLFSSQENPNRDVKKAQEFFKESLKVALKGGWKREQADALLELGKIKEAKAIYKAIGYERHLEHLKTPS